MLTNSKPLNQLNSDSNIKTILVVSKEYPPQIGGAGTIASNIVKSIISNEPSSRVKVITSNSRFWFVSMCVKLVVFLLFNKSKNSKVIINDVGATYICGLILSREILSNSIMWLHGSEKEKAFNDSNWIKRVIKFSSINLSVFKNVKYRVFVSDFLKEKFSDISITHGYRVVIQNTINNSLTGLDDLSEVSREKHLKKILTVSRVVRGKGYFRFLKAFKLLPSYFTWTIVGDGKDLKILKKAIEEEGLSDRVEFLGSKNQNELASIYKEHDLFVLLSDFEESFGLVYLEALYFGLPVVFNNKGALRETLDEFDTAFYVESDNDSNEIVKLINSLCKLDFEPNDNKYVINKKFSSNAFYERLKVII